MKILLIDNYDSFTYNLVHLFAQINGVDIDVVRNDANFLKDLEKHKYDAVIIGPGPGHPGDEEYFGQNMRFIKDFGPTGLPILGICLGFQGIAMAYGTSLKKAQLPQHGKTSRLFLLENDGLFAGIPQNIEVMRYHSLMIDADKDVPLELKFTAEVGNSSETVAANGREVMAFEHKSLPIFGLQFHPESFATELGDKMAKNFVDIIKDGQ